MQPINLGCIWLKGEVGWDMAVQFFVNLAATFYVWMKLVEG
jgi:hypothetical protein